MRASRIVGVVMGAAIQLIDLARIKHKGWRV
jgi:hypothetical protein